ncbi:MAG: cell division protein ZipA C-terminal FtsZ-binding domain-containing protein [Candidatus Competibacter sp.]|nr:cell division protein ZipA C-terminal FtsZ-binding domain-containing protein [Candidatus Competibacter sp.]MDG4585367.1 cell division protein ZipA C-terminal FtsZ-binding domain-containing protein [Candidatus Competibacter sp.]
MELDKTQLQWLLAGVGAIIVILIYLWGIRSHLKEEIGNRRHRLSKEPVLGDTPASPPDGEVGGHDFGELGRITPDHHLADKVLVDVEIRPINRQGSTATVGTDAPTDDSEARPPAALAPSQESQQEFAAPRSPKMTLVLTVMASRHQLFHGPKIQAVAEALRFRLNPEGLYELFPETEAADIPILGLAHLRKPGSFEPKTLQELHTPGLLLFMKLPGPLEEMKALDLLVITADQLAQRLGGLICDEQRNRMTNQALARLRDDVAELERQRRAQPL